MGVSTNEEWVRNHEERIRQRAHSIWEQEGRPEGRHEAHWDQACRECAEEDAGADQPAATDASNSLNKAAGMVAAAAMVGTGESGKDNDEATRRRTKATSGAPT